MRVINIYSPLELRSWRKTEGLTQRKLSQIMGLSPHYARLIGEYERGNREAIPTIKAWRRLNQYIDCDRSHKVTFVEDHKGE